MSALRMVQVPGGWTDKYAILDEDGEEVARFDSEYEAKRARKKWRRKDREREDTGFFDWIL